MEFWSRAVSAKEIPSVHSCGSQAHCWSFSGLSSWAITWKKLKFVISVTLPGAPALHIPIRMWHLPGSTSHRGSKSSWRFISHSHGTFSHTVFCYGHCCCTTHPGLASCLSNSQCDQVLAVLSLKVLPIWHLRFIFPVTPVTVLLKEPPPIWATTTTWPIPCFNHRILSSHQSIFRHPIMVTKASCPGRRKESGGRGMKYL